MKRNYLSDNKSWLKGTLRLYWNNDFSNISMKMGEYQKIAFLWHNLVKLRLEDKTPLDKSLLNPFYPNKKWSEKRPTYI